MQAVQFSGVGDIHNLACSDPAGLSTGYGSQSHIRAVRGISPLTFVSTVVIGECYLMEPKIANGKTQKLIEGAGTEGEWDRLVGVIGQVINQEEYKAQIEAGYLQFTTTFASSNSGTSLHMLYNAVHANKIYSHHVPFQRYPLSQWTQSIHLWSLHHQQCNTFLP